MNQITVKVTKNGTAHPGKAYTISIQVPTPIAECDTWEEAYTKARKLASDIRKSASIFTGGGVILSV